MILPHSTESEIQVLGSLLFGDHEYVDLIFNLLEADDFYSKKHAHLFEVFRDMNIMGVKIDTVSVCNTMGSEITEDRLAAMMEKVISVSNVDFHAAEVKDYSRKRKLIKLASDVVKSAMNPGLKAEQIIAEQDVELYKIADAKNREKYHHIKEIQHEGIKKVEEAFRSGKHITGVQCYYSEIDSISAGFQPQDIIILAARPGIGKTALSLNMAYNMAKHGTPVGYFSLEMSSVQLWRRIISLHTGINQENIIKGDVTEKDIKRMLDSGLDKMPIFIDDSSGSNISSIRNKARLMKRRENVQMIFVDYIGLVTAEDTYTNRNNELTYISSRLKGVAKELNIPIMVLSQMSRESARLGKRPTLIDLRDSGSLEQDASIVMFIYRPDMAGVESYGDGKPTKDMAEILIEKNRNGRLGKLEMRFQPEIGRFSGLDDIHEEPPQKHVDWLKN